MKFIKYILPAILFGIAVVSCDTDVENTEIIRPYTYSPLYYQNLRDYKNSDHAIAWAWVSDYIGENGSMATSFLGLPDSLDIISLWGGIPVPDSIEDSRISKVAEEMRFVQKVKGTKLVSPHFVGIDGVYLDIWRQGDAAATVAERDSLHLLAMDSMVYYRLRPIFENGLDGIDLDNETSGIMAEDANMTLYVKRLGRFLGPMASSNNVHVYPDGFTIRGDSTMLLCVDGYAPPKECEPYMNYWVLQAYGRGAGENPKGFAWEKCVYTENVGDYWNAGCGHLLEQAAWQPPTGRKGGFGGFYMHRDYINTTATWQGQTYHFSNYAHLRLGIQLQNPAIH